MKSIILLILLVLFNGVIAQNKKKEQTKKTEQESPQVKEPEAISITEIPSLADEAYQYLKKLEKDLKPEADIIRIKKEIPQALDSLKILSSDSIYHNLSSLSPRSLQGLAQEWSLYLERLNDAEQVLLKRSHFLEQEKARIQKLSDEWSATSEAVRSGETPEAILERVESTVVGIDTMQALLSERINALLVLENLVSKAKIKINDTINRINTTESQLRTQLFVHDSPTLWEAFIVEGDTASVVDHIYQSWNNFSRALSRFSKLYRSGLYLHVIIFLLLLVLMIYFDHLNKAQNLFDEGDEILKASASFISRPFSAALLTSLFFTVWLYPNATATMVELFLVLFLLPVMRLAPSVIVPERIKAVHVLGWLYIALFLHNNIVGYQLLQRLIMLAISVITIVLFIWLMRSVRPLYEQKLRPWAKLIFYILPGGIFLLFISVIANFIGSVGLADTITTGVIKSLILAIFLFTIARVFDGLVILLIRKRAAKSLHFVQTYADKMEKWTVIVIHVTAFLLWIRSVLKAFHLFILVQAWYKNLLEIHWTFGTVTISVQNIVDFILAIILTFIFSRLIRIVLDLEIFPRVRLPRGIPGAISMVSRYTIVAIGIFLALSSLGIDLGKFGLLAGALGVGLGFGLQNVIANFVSGLILAFERPIQVGDKVEVGSVLGNVKQIGVRSSTVKTFDGSEVIVPNADLISNQVINWTLTDTRQRMKLPVKVAFDNDPEQVLEILLNVVQDHPEVLKEPSPVATFNGFGDYFLDFTLYYWITDNILRIKTEVAIQVHRRLREAGIEKPRPLQELNLRFIENADKVEFGEKKLRRQTKKNNDINKKT